MCNNISGFCPSSVKQFTSLIPLTIGCVVKSKFKLKGARLEEKGVMIDLQDRDVGNKTVWLSCAQHFLAFLLFVLIAEYDATDLRILLVVAIWESSS